MHEGSNWQLRTILVPIDRSAACRSALDVAINVARCNGVGTLHLIHAVDPDVFGAVSADLDRQMIEPLIERGRSLLAAATKHIGDAGLKATSEVIEAAPVDAILDTLARIQADLVVLATRGRTGIRRILGSVGLAVIAYAPCSVLAIPEIAPGWDIRCILLPWDRVDEEFSQPVVEMARKRDAELLVLAETEEVVSAARDFLTGAGVRGEVLRGGCQRIEEAIITAAHQHAADVVVLFPRPEGARGVKIDRRSQILLHELHCPLLIVRRNRGQTTVSSP